MRIDAYNKISEVYNTSNAKNTKKANAVKSKDSLEISKTGQAYNLAKQAIALTPDIREDKVNAIKTALASGVYNVSNEEVVEHILNKNFDATI